MPAKLLQGQEVSRSIYADVSRRVAELRLGHWEPHLVSLDISGDFSVELYVRNQRRIAERLGIVFENRQFDPAISQERLLATIHSLNVNRNITGIILQRPIPPHLSLHELHTAISPYKDVEGMHPANIGKAVYNEFDLAPCTSLAAVNLLKESGLDLVGMEVTILCQDEVVAKPIALHLMAELATVTNCHMKTVDLQKHTLRADALIVALDKPRVITADMIKEGAVVIDVGLNPVPVTDDQGNPIVGKNGKQKFRLVGDVEFDSVSQVAGWITPVPGGVGPITLALLMRNTAFATETQKRLYEGTI